LHRAERVDAVTYAMSSVVLRAGRVSSEVTPAAW